MCWSRMGDHASSEVSLIPHYKIMVLLGQLLIQIREHLYRCHTLPIHCLRCHGVFPSEEGLRVHSLSDTPCQRREAGDHAEDPLEGIGLSQERQLRSRKRTTKTEEDKWKDAYKICFPDDTLIPSPCRSKTLGAFEFISRIGQC